MAKSTVVTNAGPLIYLALLDHLPINLRSDLDLLIQHNFRISPNLYEKLVHPRP